MSKDFGLENRKYVIGGVAMVIIIIYIIRLFVLQIMSEDYKKNADSNAFLKKIEFPPVAPSPTATANSSFTTSMPTT